MTRGSQKKRQGITRRPSRRHGSNVFAYITIAAVIIVVAGLGAFAFRTISAQANVDEFTLCRTEGPQRKLAILLDLTDPLSTTQAQLLDGILGRLIDELPADTLVGVGVVSEESDRWGAQFQKCKPASGTEANELYQNPTLINERFEEEFRRPLQDVLEAMMRQTEQDTSPIMESLQALIADITRREGKLSLVIVSDLLQNSQTLSVYRGETWETFSERGGASRLARNLGGADLTLVRVPRPSVSLDVKANADRFWAEYFDIQGVSAPFDVEILGDL